MSSWLVRTPGGQNDPRFATSVSFKMQLVVFWTPEMPGENPDVFLLQRLHPIFKLIVRVVHLLTAAFTTQREQYRLCCARLWTTYDYCLWFIVWYQRDYGMSSVHDTQHVQVSVNDTTYVLNHVDCHELTTLCTHVYRLICNCCRTAALLSSSYTKYFFIQCQNCGFE